MAESAWLRLLKTRGYITLKDDRVGRTMGFPVPLRSHAAWATARPWPPRTGGGSDPSADRNLGRAADI